MTPEKLFLDLLGLGLNWEGVESRFDRSGDLGQPASVDYIIQG